MHIYIHYKNYKSPLELETVVNESTFNTRESFGEVLEARFNAGTSAVKVDYTFFFKQSKI